MTNYGTAAASTLNSTKLWSAQITPSGLLAASVTTEILRLMAARAP